MSKESRDGWEITEMTYCLPNFTPRKVDLDQLGWWLYHRQIANIWWNEEYFLYFNANTDLTTNHVTKTVLIFTEIDNVYYTVGKYKKFVKINLETWKTELTDRSKNSTENIHIPVFDLPNPLVLEILDKIKKMEEQCKIIRKRGC